MTTLTLHKGDCLAVMKDISANSVDLIICDLPYGCLTNQKTGGKAGGTLSVEKYGKGRYPHTELSNCRWDIKIDLEKFWTEAKRILKNEHSPVIHFCTTKFGYELIKSNESWFRYDLVWNKQRGVSFLQANKMPMRAHEMIYVFSKAGAYYNRVDISGNFTPSKGGCKGSKVYNIEPKIHKRSDVSNVHPKVKDSVWTNQGTNLRCALSVVNQVSVARKDNHPTEKPVELYKWLIQRYCPPGGIILDPTFGSGNSVFTAYEMGMNAIGIEKDDKFFEKAEKKLNTIE